MVYLKYYFGYKNGQVYLDSLACNDNGYEQPDNFLKWYEKGDLGPPDKRYLDEVIHKPDAFWSIFAPRQLNFSVEKILNNHDA